MVGASVIKHSRIGTQLLDWYGRYVGEPDRESVVYVGFTLFFGGIGLATVGVATFLWSMTLSGNIGHIFALREVAGASGAVGLPLVLLGVTVLLPVDRRTLFASLLGTVICLGAVVLFVRAYPVNWNVNAARDMSGQVVAVYAVGIAAVIGGTGAALVGHHLSRAAAESIDESDSARTDETDGITDEQVRQDIDRAMAGAELSWGGVEKKETRRLKLSTGTIDEADTRNLDTATAKTTRASGSSVNDAVSGLRKLQGRDETTASGQGTDDQAAALRELRDQQRREAEREVESTGILPWIRNRLP